MAANSDIGLPLEWRDEVIAWAMANDAVRELWLFGSRAQDSEKPPVPSSDVGLGMALMPPHDDANWALAAYAAKQNKWQGELQMIVGCHVTLVPMIAGNEGAFRIRMTGDRLWIRPPPATEPR